MGENGEITVMSENILKLLQKMENVENRLTEVENKLDFQINVISKKVELIEKTVEEIDSSQHFINKSFETLKLQTESLIKRDTEREKAVLELSNRVNKLEKELNKEKAERNALDQYQRSCYNVKIMGAKMTDDEDNLSKELSGAATLKLVNDIASSAKKISFDSSQIDVCHRIPSKKKSNFPPSIIIKF